MSGRGEREEGWARRDEVRNCVVFSSEAPLADREMV